MRYSGGANGAAIMIIETDTSDRSGAEALHRYELNGAYDEMFSAVDHPRKQYRPLHNLLLNLGPDELRRSKHEADQSFFNQGITFTVYGNDKGTERIFPHDLLPRIITAAEWEKIERGLTQRITALNLFLKDVYHEGKIIEDGVVPGSIVYTCKHYRREMRGIKVPARRVYHGGRYGLDSNPGRELCGPGGQSARPQRRLLHAHQPPGDEADISRTVSKMPRSAD